MQFSTSILVLGTALAVLSGIATAMPEGHGHHGGHRVPPLFRHPSMSTGGPRTVTSTRPVVPPRGKPGVTVGAATFRRRAFEDSASAAAAAAAAPPAAAGAAGAAAAPGRASSFGHASHASEFASGNARIRGEAEMLTPADAASSHRGGSSYSYSGSGSGVQQHRLPASAFADGTSHGGRHSTLALGVPTGGSGSGAGRHAYGHAQAYNYGYAAGRGYGSRAPAQAQGYGAQGTGKGKGKLTSAYNHEADLALGGNSGGHGQGYGYGNGYGNSYGYGHGHGQRLNNYAPGPSSSHGSSHGYSSSFGGRGRDSVSMGYPVRPSGRVGVAHYGTAGMGRPASSAADVTAQFAALNLEAPSASSTSRSLARSRSASPIGGGRQGQHSSLA